MIRALLLLLIGCGRIGFESTDAGGAAVVPPATETKIDRFTTTSSTFVEVPGSTVTLPPSPGTRWLILVSGTLLSSSFLEIGVEARYLIDGVERGIGGTQAVANERPGPWQHFYVHEGTATPSQITVELRDATGTTAVIDSLRVVTLPLPATADPLYASGDPEQIVNAATFLPWVTLSMTPASPGDYVFLLLANTSDAPGESDIFTRWLDPTGQLWTTSLHMPRTSWQSSLYLRRATLDGSPLSLVLEANTGNTAGRMRDVRVLALRTDGFPSFELAQDALLQTTTSPAVTITNRLNPVGSASRFLYLASALVEADCANVSAADRGIHLVIDATTEVFRHVTENCSYETTYGTAHLLPVRPDLLELGFSSGNAELVSYKESSLLLIGLD